MVSKIVNELFANTPGETLYHYTTFKGLFGIIDSQALWASDIRYMNDAAELRHTVDLVRTETRSRINAGVSDARLLNAFVDWFSRKLTTGNLLFASSFRENGNLLSQWRGYSTVGKGVSLGLDPNYLQSIASKQGFRIARCIYDPLRQSLLICKLIDSVEQMARNAEGGYEDIFSEIESELLTIAAILKHPSFEEEAEWRIISPVYSEQENNVQFREGRSMIVPYVEFLLSEGGHLNLQHVYLGPSPNSQNSINSLKMFLDRNDALPANGISECQIPYRLR